MKGRHVVGAGLLVIAAGVAAAIATYEDASGGGTGRRPQAAFEATPEWTEIADRPREIPGKASVGLSSPVRLSTAPVVEENPRAPNYDPVQVAKLLDRPHDEIFAAEPRDGQWAPEFETAMQSLIEADLAEDLPDARIGAIECRTSSCRVVVSAADADAETVSAYVQSFVPIGTSVSVAYGESAEGRRELVFHGLIPRDLRGPDQFGSWHREYRGSRASALARFRDHRTSTE